MATYFIGDIQGCFNELQAILERVQFCPDKDEIWFTGDLVARGPDSLAVLNFVRSLGSAAKVVLGNHDLHLIAIYEGIKKPKKSDKLNALLAAENLDELITWLRSQPLIQYSQTQQIVMTHAGISPQWSIAQALQHATWASDIIKGPDAYPYLADMYHNTPALWDESLEQHALFRYTINSFTRMRYCNPDMSLNLTCKSSPDQADKNLIPWFEFSKHNIGEHTLVFGHWAALMGKTELKNMIALDTGCVWGNHLTLYRLEDKQYFTLDAF
ncbi:symmetrical bis(5'-nucleosyl)-tetraphosphatase [Flocculibacter collagenilyticus]|uniref:symmetrical bis(5'-nucleosyl)-tetraphosphatase n=1 Tax=Flocculibacter collagenilyticus TaxID=2744479 RepID=UPI0018F57568|nr:symmetrical bis(5'-nucleosyl)-tetraphosphatase [Flocculibacter collagenilyticus]